MAESKPVKEKVKKNKDGCTWEEVHICKEYTDDGKLDPQSGRKEWGWVRPNRKSVMLPNGIVYSLET